MQMPELPEVETIVKQLRAKIAGKIITKLEVLEPKVVDPKISSILPLKIKDVLRRGKFIIIPLDGSSSLLVHLKMTGHFHYVEAINKTKDQKHKQYLSRIFHLDDNSFFTFNEIRKFGMVNLVANGEMEKYLSKFGPEPLTITAENFQSRLQKFPRSVIKTKLLDQKFIAGIGNIYAQEVLYYAGIKPTQKIKDIPLPKIYLLHSEIQRVLKLSIENNGTTVSDYTHLSGKGNFQNFLAVYGQQNCPKGHSLHKINIGGRSTSFCQVCQD